MTSVTYKVIVKNKSGKPWTFFLYQSPPADAPDAKPLVWMASPYNVAAGDQYPFSWTATYQFAWADTGPLEPEAVFSAHDFKEADPKNKNVTNFTVQENTPSLSDSTGGGPHGSLVIKDGPKVPSDRYSVGIAMFSHAIYALNAGPNLTHNYLDTLRTTPLPCLCF